jgi:perosamine synthetase
MIPHNLPTFSSEEQIALTKVLTSGWVAQGSQVESFENELCQFIGLPSGHAVVVSSGSAALYLALWVLDGKDKKIGLPVYACAALRNAVGLIQGESVYLDCEKGGPNVDMSAATQAGLDILIAPSMFGIPVKLPNKNNFEVVEDIAQSIGASISGDRIGLRGKVGICSFYATKLLTSGGQGGAIISRDKSIIDKIRDYREFDCRDDIKLRFNFQMTDIQAAIGRIQLNKLPKFLEHRARLFEIYREAGLDLIGSVTDELRLPVRYRAVMRCTEPKRLIEALHHAGIYAIIPIEHWELLDVPEKYPVAEKITYTTVSLPIYPALKDRDAEKIANIARNFA